MAKKAPRKREEFWKFAPQSCASPEAIEAYNEDNRKIFYPSTFGFLQCHHGVRPACLHGLLATMGAGKSSLTKKLIAEAAEGARVLVFLTEESILEFQAGINAINSHGPVLDNISFVEQRQFKENADTIEGYRGIIHDILFFTRPAVFFIDNITTSVFYGEHVPPWEQAKTIQWLADLCKDLGTAIFYVAHTKKDVSDNMPRMITPEDIRGSAMLPIQTEYFYVMQKFKGNAKQYNVVSVCKHRHHPKAGGYYLLHYDNGKYLKDTKIQFDEVNKIFKERDHLGKRQRRDD